MVYFAILLRPQAGELLVQNDFRLPRIHHDGDDATDVWKLCRKAQELLGNSVQLFLLRTEGEVSKPSLERSTLDYQRSILIFEVLSTQDAAAPPGMLWIPKSEVLRVSYATEMPCVKQFVQNYRDKGLSYVEDRLYPYSAPGWIKQAAEWIQKESKANGFDVIEIEQMTRKAEGCILRARTACESLIYFKEVGPNTFFDEVTVADSIAEVLPTCFVKPLSVERDRKWLLMLGQGKVLAGEDACLASRNPDLFRNVLTTWVSIQRKSIPLVSRLRDKGVEVVDGPYVRKLVDEMMSDSEWTSQCYMEILRMTGDAPFESDYQKTLLMDYLSDICTELSQFQVPITLVHGDLNALNVVDCKEDGFRFIDFASTCVSNPFRDLYLFAQNCDASEDDLDFFFEMWKDCDTIERLRQMYRAISRFEVVISCCTIHRWYRTIEYSRKLERMEACTSFALMMIQLHLLSEGRTTTSHS